MSGGRVDLQEQFQGHGTIHKVQSEVVQGGQAKGFGRRDLRPQAPERLRKALEYTRQGRRDYVHIVLIIYL